MQTHYTHSGNEDRQFKFEDETRKLLTEIVTRIAVMEEIQKSNIDIIKRVHKLEIANAIALELKPQKVSLWIKMGGAAAGMALVLGVVNLSTTYENNQQKGIETFNLRKQQEENISTISDLKDEIKMLNDAR